MSASIGDSLLRPKARLALLAFSIILILTALLDNRLRHGRVTEAAFRNHTQAGYLRECDGCERLDTDVMGTLTDQIRQMYKPAIQRIDYDAEEHEMRWDTLGKDLCIADIDTRSYDKEGQILSKTFNWNDTDSLSAGMFNHYFYASIHGYKYHLIQNQEWPDHNRDNVWSKLYTVLELLDSCRVLLVLDSDVVIQQLDLPFEWLLNRWNITYDTALAMPWDTEGLIPGGHPDASQTPNTDERGNLNVNAGVVVAQNLPRTREMIKAWISCPDEIAECKKYRHGWPAEQGAFANFIRYTYADDFKTIPCNDANGYPEQKSSCNGKFLRHFTTVKANVKQNTEKVMLDALAKVFTAYRSPKVDTLDKI